MSRPSIAVAAAILVVAVGDVAECEESSTAAKCIDDTEQAANTVKNPQPDEKAEKTGSELPEGLLVGQAKTVANKNHIRARVQQFNESLAPGVGSDVGIPTPKLTFFATEENKKAEGSVGLPFGDTLFNLRVSTPVQEGQDIVTPVSLDGLANGASAEFSLSRLVWPANPNNRELEELCGCKTAPCGCDVEDFADSEKRTEFEEALNFAKTLQIYGVKIGAGRNDFKWIDPSTLADQRERHNNWTVGAVAGVYNSRIGFLAAGFDYQGVYEPGNKYTICRPIGDTDGEKCQDRPLEGPTKKNKAIGRIEWRRFLFGSRVALNPIASRDFKSRVNSLEIPVYFLQNADDKGLNGGVSVGWRSDQKGMVAQVFIGASLAVLGN